MAPETRSRGVPAPSRVYHSTPTLQQVQFPARRKRVRRHHGDSHDGHPPSLKQQTLTQIDFVSSFDEDGVVTLSDADDGNGDDDDDDDPDKENASPQPHETQDEGDEPESPVPKRARRARRRPEKRRRTMGDGEKGSSRKDDDDDQARRRRRRTLGDMSGASRYHTQTLTQFLGHHTSFVADSDDDDHHEMDDGFLSWLEQENRLKSPGAGERATTTTTTTTAATRPSTVAGASRENSVIPQTPNKGGFVAPRADDVASLTDGMLARYGPPGQQDTPSRKMGRLARRDQQASSPRPRASPDYKQQQQQQQQQQRDTTPSQKRASLVMQDSQATASWTTPGKSQDGAPTGGESPSPLTPTKSQGGAPTGGESSSPSTTTKTQDDAPTGGKLLFPSTPAKVPLGESTRPPKRLVADDVFEIPDSDEEGEALDASPLETPGRRRRDDDCFAAGAETQAAMQEIHSRTGTPQDGHAEPDVSGPRKASSRALQVTEPMRTPLHQPNHHHHSSQPSQPWESQRVPASILRSLPAPSARSDILLPVSSAALEALATGHCTHITAPFRIPGQVARFWLFEERVLRYMACVGPGEEEASSSSSSSSQQQAASRSPSSSRQPAWRYYASQVYELNNPVCQEDMQEEGWIAAPPVTRYVYLPPAVVGQLLWNLRHALFADPVDEQQQRTSPSSSPSSSPRAEHRQQMGRVPPPASMTLSQQVDAQIHSDMASSTLLPPDGTADDAPTRLPSPPAPPPPPYSSSSSPGPTRQPVYPSQATTLSQASTPSQQGQQHGHAPPESATASESRAPHPPLPAAADSNTATTAVPCPFGAGSPPSSSLCSLPSSSLPSAVPPLPSLLLSSSQLLSKSQMLPDSLVRAYEEPPPHSHPHSHSHSYPRPEIWDSDGDEDDAPL
ncbi:hypothetical protein AAL_04053 [Moelleriella libera RCEF 2490]|uniref:Uncharacterized protein n=1 Tax=Moelleriella libera RCEF 2490 TaxID=1081109 RepID=A0A168CNG7_9HYPO|nr:hypothetical protein AAL_04053 [Moelleriella libera RCEF 2490]